VLRRAARTPQASRAHTPTGTRMRPHTRRAACYAHPVRKSTVGRILLHLYSRLLSAHTFACIVKHMFASCAGGLVTLFPVRVA
jgi:hypothetical protein